MSSTRLVFPQKAQIQLAWVACIVVFVIGNPSF
jgi:hypothetical protein